MAIFCANCCMCLPAVLLDSEPLVLSVLLVFILPGYRASLCALFSFDYMALVTVRVLTQSAKFPQVVAGPQSLPHKLVIHPLASCRPQSRHQVQALKDRVYIPVLFNYKDQCSPSLTGRRNQLSHLTTWGLGTVGLPEPLTKPGTMISASGFPSFAYIELFDIVLQPFDTVFSLFILFVFHFG